MVLSKNDFETDFFEWAGFHVQESIIKATHLIFMATGVFGMDRQSEGI